MPRPAKPERFVDEKAAKNWLLIFRNAAEFWPVMLFVRFWRLAKGVTTKEISAACASFEILREIALARFELDCSQAEANEILIKNFDAAEIEWVPIPVFAAKPIATGWEKYTREKGISFDEAMQLAVKRGQGVDSSKQLRNIIDAFQSAWLVAHHRARSNLKGNNMSEDDACREVADTHPEIYGDIECRKGDEDDPAGRIKEHYKKERENVAIAFDLLRMPTIR